MCFLRGVTGKRTANNHWDPPTKDDVISIGVKELPAICGHMFPRVTHTLLTVSTPSSDTSSSVGKYAVSSL